MDADGRWAEIAFVVDEKFQNIGIATTVFQLLAKLAKKSGMKGFWADVLSTNTAMMKVFEKSGWPVQKQVEDGVYHVTIAFEA